MSIAQEVSKSLADRVVIAKVSVTYSSCSVCEDQLLFLQVDGELWDLERPLEKSCNLELLDFEHPEGLSR
jgi:threonyl-tRNA synthetase